VQKWHGIKFFRNVQTKRKCGLWKELAVARRNVPHCAKVSWPKRNIARKECTSASVGQESREDGRSGGDISWNQNAAMA
jgi:hypothetical protein